MQFQMLIAIIYIANYAVDVGQNANLSVFSLKASSPRG